MSWPKFVLAAAVLLLVAPLVMATNSRDVRPLLQLCEHPQEWQDHPILCQMVQHAVTRPKAVAELIQNWALDHGLLVDITTPSYHPDDDNTFEFNSTILTKKKQENQRLSSSGGEADVWLYDVPYPQEKPPPPQQQQLPVVLAHGMGDSCFNDGMQRVTQRVSQLLGGVYTTCIAVGANQEEDTMNGYFMNMNDSVQIFAESIRNNNKLTGGFHAMGFSQGNNVIRGYIAKYNDPPVHTFISVNGVNAGVGAVPYCRPRDVSSSSSNKQQWSLLKSLSLSSLPLPTSTSTAISSAMALPSMCDLLMEQASRAAYTTYAQQHSFQANYWRDPRKVATDRYKTYSQLAIWNNEGYGSINQTLRDNWAKTWKFVWIMANQDKMVWPKEGEHWGAPDSNQKNPFQQSSILPMNQTEWYIQDLFGLRTAQDAGKNIFESFDGDHLQFTQQDFERWVTSYLKF